MARDGKRATALPNVGTEFAGVTYVGVDSIEIDAAGRKKYIWKMRCSCGEEFSRPENNIKTAHRRFVADKRKQATCGSITRHCGVSIGEHIGRLTIKEIYISSQNKNGTPMKDGCERTYADCLCDCGKPYSVLTRKLLAARRTGQRISCGCWKIEYLSEAKSTHGLSRPLDGDQRDKRFTMFHAAKSRAKKEGIPFDIEITDIDKPRFCPILEYELDWESSGKASFNSPSLDKFYPEYGYVKGNVHVISYRANTMKNDGSPEEWKKIAEWCEQEVVKKKLRGEG